MLVKVKPFISRYYFKRGEVNWKQAKELFWNNTGNPKLPFDPFDVLQPYDITQKQNGYPILVKKIQKGNVELSTHSPSNLAYHCSKQQIFDKWLWRELEFNILRNLNQLSQRALFGALYGFLQCKTVNESTLEVLWSEFNKKQLQDLNPFEILELLQALTFQPKYKSYAAEQLIPILKKLEPKPQIFHNMELLAQFIRTCITLEIKDKEIWDKSLSTILRKKKWTTDKWIEIYEAIQLLKSNQNLVGGIDLNQYVEFLTELWNNEKDFQWHYNIKEGRRTTLEEKTNKDVDSETWQKTEEYCKQSLPQYYWQTGREMKEEDYDWQNVDELLNLIKTK